MTPMDVRGKNILVFGLGLLGGGLATTTWLLRQGAIVRVTDKKDSRTLAVSIKKIGKHENLSYTLGIHSEEDVRWADVIVVNPGVPKESPYLALARRMKKPLWNDTALFFSHTNRPIVGVTGTRGKTTVTAWIAQLLSTKTTPIVPTGNTPENPLLLEIDRKVSSRAPVVAELSSWQLELLPVAGRAPNVAVITNLYPDHLNRYHDIREYADAKANIFVDQHKNDVLILNIDHPWTPYFLKKKPRARILYTSLRPLPKTKEGMCVVDGFMTMALEGKVVRVCSVERFQKERGEHNVMNLLQAVLAARLTTPGLKVTEKNILALTAPRFRQEVVKKKENVMVINDTTATSPDGTIAALRRFTPQGQVTIIVGGTDKELDFTDLAKEIKATLTPEQVIFLEGSATKKLQAVLGRWGSTSRECTTLKECIRVALDQTKRSKAKQILLFSPGAASFEKFKNEFHRGEEFNKHIKTLMK